MVFVIENNIGTRKDFYNLLPRKIVHSEVAINLKLLLHIEIEMGSTITMITFICLDCPNYVIKDYEHTTEYSIKEGLVPTPNICCEYFNLVCQLKSF